jgi:hypothetical protein
MNETLPKSSKLGFSAASVCHMSSETHVMVKTEKLKLYAGITFVSIPRIIAHVKSDVGY